MIAELIRGKLTRAGCHSRRSYHVFHCT